MKTQVHEDELLEAIKAGVTTCTPIAARLDAHYRAVDRALQRARKKGLIRFDTKKGWSPTPNESEEQKET